MGVLLFKGMKCGFLEGDFSLFIDDDGKLQSKCILSTSYNVIPVWLRIAYDNLCLARTASEKIQKEWCEDSEIQKKLLISELTPSIQVFVSCGIVLDATYDQFKKFSKISNEEFLAWKKNGTKRAAQIFEVIKRVFKLKGEYEKAFQKNITSIIDYRNDIVHPSHRIRQSCTRPDIPVGIDWRFSAYRYFNAEICYMRTMEMLSFLYQTKSGISAVDEEMGNIFEALQELGLANITKQD